MSENFTDYDLDIFIRKIATYIRSIDQETISERSPKELFDEIQNHCPKAADILLERVFEKDKLKEYLKKSGMLPRANEDIIGDGDKFIEEQWKRLTELYPMLLDAIKQCNEAM